MVQQQIYTKSLIVAPWIMDACFLIRKALAGHLTQALQAFSFDLPR